MNRIALEKIEQFEKDQRKAELLRRLVIPDSDQRRNEKVELLKKLGIAGGAAAVTAPIRLVDQPTAPKPSARPAGHKHPQRWEQVRITFISDERVQITVDGRPHSSRNYEEMGLSDRRTRSYKKAWETLRQLSGHPDGMQMDKKRAQEIRAALKKLFPSISSPALIYQTGSGYCPSFHLDRSRSFDA